MKTVISLDDILLRDSSTDIVDCFLDFFEDAEVYALAHRPNRLLGPVERRKIHASFLSARSDNPRVLKKSSFLAPAACSKLFIPCSIDVIVNFSRGLSHGIKRCQQSHQLTYLYDFAHLPSRETWTEKFFGGYVTRWSVKELNKINTLWCSSETLKSSLKNYVEKDIKVVRPFVNLHEFPPIPENVEKYFIERTSLLCWI